MQLSTVFQLNSVDGPNLILVFSCNSLSMAVWPRSDRRRPLPSANRIILPAVEIADSGEFGPSHWRADLTRPDGPTVAGGSGRTDLGPRRRRSAVDGWSGVGFEAFRGCLAGRCLLIMRASRCIGELHGTGILGSHGRRRGDLRGFVREVRFYHPNHWRSGQWWRM